MTIKEIQQNMNCDAQIIFRNNHFLGQDILDTENKILSLTCFSGSAGTLIVTKEHAFLFVDGRYEIQSKQQTNPQEITVIVESQDNNINTWMKDNLSQSEIAYNPWQISADKLQYLQNILPLAHFVPQAENPPTAKAKVFEHDIEYAGLTADKKISDIADMMCHSGDDAAFFAAADSVSWLTNLRSDALPETPILRAMALLTKDKELTLFADNLELPEKFPYKVVSFSELEKALSSLSGKKLAITRENTPAVIAQICHQLGILLSYRRDVAAYMKAEKNPAELSGMIEAHIRDGVALCRFLAWFDKNYHGKSEMDIVDKLLEFRKEQALFHSVSFATIAGADSNAAIIHYQPTEQKHSMIKDNSLLLLDSGGQYFDGTTDVTRTIATGTPTDEMKQKFTIVLKAHIALSSQLFPYHTSGTKLDTVCRSAMWKYGLDYKHGTGHGVGYFLNVHEGPQNLGANSSSCELRPNMVVSIEPGYYRENAFGIRIENLVYIAKDKEHTDFLKFVPLTMAPIDFRLIDKYLLSNGEIEWLNNYHRLVYETIAPKLNAEEQDWLKKVCAPL